MKQHLSPEQTAKLIEMGFEKPKMAAPALKWVDGEPTFEPQYTIGELIEMLPKHIHLDGLCLDLHIYANQHLATVKYSGLFCEKFYRSCSKEIADALYDMIINLKEERVI